MTQNYWIVKTDKGHVIMEVESGLMLKSFNNRSIANNICRHLNNGGGFDGLTPPFFADKKLNIKH